MTTTTTTTTPMETEEGVVNAFDDYPYAMVMAETAEDREACKTNDGVRKVVAKIQREVAKRDQDEIRARDVVRRDGPNMVRALEKMQISGGTVPMVEAASRLEVPQRSKRGLFVVGMENSDTEVALRVYDIATGAEVTRTRVLPLDGLVARLQIADTPGVFPLVYVEYRNPLNGVTVGAVGDFRTAGETMRPVPLVRDDGFLLDFTASLGYDCVALVCKIEDEDEYAIAFDPEDPCVAAPLHNGDLALFRKEPKEGRWRRLIFPHRGKIRHVKCSFVGSADVLVVLTDWYHVDLYACGPADFAARRPKPLATVDVEPFLPLDPRHGFEGMLVAHQHVTLWYMNPVTFEWKTVVVPVACRGGAAWTAVTAAARVHPCDLRDQPFKAEPVGIDSGGMALARDDEERYAVLVSAPVPHTAAWTMAALRPRMWISLDEAFARAMSEWIVDEAGRVVQWPRDGPNDPFPAFPGDLTEDVHASVQVVDDAIVLSHCETGSMGECTVEWASLRVVWRDGAAAKASVCRQSPGPAAPAPYNKVVVGVPGDAFFVWHFACEVPPYDSARQVPPEFGSCPLEERDWEGLSKSIETTDHAPTTGLLPRMRLARRAGRCTAPGCGAATKRKVSISGVHGKYACSPRCALVVLDKEDAPPSAAQTTSTNL